MIGGMGNDTITEILQGKIEYETLKWQKIPYTTADEPVKGRQCHTAVEF